MSLDMVQVPGFEDVGPQGLAADQVKPSLSELSITGTRLAQSLFDETPFTFDAMLSRPHGTLLSVSHARIGHTMSQRLYSENKFGQ
jgi:hypothetical protein